MSKYAELDAAIIERLKRGPTPFWSIAVGKAGLIADDIQRRTNFASDGWRIIDTRLQALRKAGKIRADRRNGWTLVEESN